MFFKKRAFPNGLRVIVAPMANTETVTLLVLVGTGANYEERKTSGLSHFLEHMFFKGTKKYPTPGQLDRMLDAVGAMHNAFTSREETGYWIKVDAKHFDLALMFVSEILQNALLKEEEINRERGVILEEMKMYWDDPRRYVWALFESALYGNNSYGWDVIGTPENIKRMKRSTFVTYWRSQYIASNTVVVVAGNVSLEAAFKKIEQAFRTLRTGKPRQAPALRKIVPQARVGPTGKDTDQTHLLLGGLGYPLNHKDRLIADVLATILGGYMSSRLFMEIRGKLGLAYSIHASHQAYRTTGYFAAYAGVPHASSQEVVSRMLANFSKVKRSGVSAEELMRAKDNIKGHLAISLESTDEVASFLGAQEILLSRIWTPEEVVRKLERITQEDVQRVSRRLFGQKNLLLVLIGPNPKAASFEKLLGLAA